MGSEASASFRSFKSWNRMTADRSGRPCEREHHKRLSQTSRHETPHQRKRTSRGLSTAIAGPALTVLICKAQGSSGWVQKAMPSSYSLVLRGAQWRQLIPVGDPSCKAHDTTGVVSYISSREPRREYPENAATRCRRYFQPPCGVFRSGTALDVAGNAVEVPGETPQVAKLLRPTGEFPVTISTSSHNTNLAGRASSSAGVSAAVAGAEGVGGSMGAQRRGCNEGTPQRKGKGERVRAVLPDPVVNEIKWWGRRGMWQKAEEALEKTIRAGGPPNISAYEAAIFAMGHSTKWQKALLLLDKMVANGIEPDERCYAEAIKACGKAGKFDEAVGLLETMVKNDSSPSLAIFNMVLESCLIQKRAEQVPGVLVKMRQCGVQPNDETDRLAMLAVVAGRDWSQIVAMWKTLTKGGNRVRGLKPKELLTIAKALGGLGEWKMVLQVLDVSALERYDGLPLLTLESFNYIVTAHACLGDGAAVLRAIREMEASGHHADAVTYTYAFDNFARGRGRHWASALEVFEAVRSSSTSTYTVSSEGLESDSSAVDGAPGPAVDRNLDKLDKTSNSREGGGGGGGVDQQLSRQTVVGIYLQAGGQAEDEKRGEGSGAERIILTDDMWNSVINTVAQGKQLQKARSLLEEAQAVGVAINASCYDSIIFEMGKNGEHNDLLALVTVAEKRGLKLSRHSHNWVLVSLNKLGRPQDTLSAADGIFERGMQLSVVGYNAAMHAAGELGLTRKALELFAKMKQERGLSPTQVSYASALTACAKATTDIKEYGQKAITLLEEMNSSGIQPYPPAHRAAIAAVAAAEGHQGAMAVLADMKAKAIPLTGYSYSPFLKCAAKAADWAACVGVLDSMAEAARTDPAAAPDLMCFNFAISACANAHKGEVALKLLGRMKASGLQPTLISYTTAMDACAKSGWWGETLDLMAELRSKGLEPNVVTYNVAIEACANAGHFASVMALIDEMATSSETSRPTVFTFSTALKACNSWDMAEQVMTKMRSMAIKPNLVTYTALISICGKTGDVQQALAQLDNARKEGLSPNLINYNCCVDVCAKSGEADRALALLEQMQASGDPQLAPDLVTFNSVINACAKAGDWALTLWLLSEIKAAGLKADIQSFNAALDACTKGSNPEAAVALLGRMRAQGLAPDAISYQSAISACRRGGDSAAAVKLMKEMEGDGFCPGEAEYNLVIETVGREGDWDSAVDLLKQMKEDGIEPDVFSYGAAVGACSKGRNPAMARALLQEMRELGHQPNKFCWNAVINVHARTGDTQGALALMKEMKQNMECDESTFSSVVHGCAQTREWDTACRLLEEMREAGFKPNDSCYYALVSAACTAGELDLAQEFLSSMAEDGVPADSYAYSALLSGCGRAGEWERALRILREMKSGGVEPTLKVYTSVLRACAGAAEVGQAAQVVWDLLEEMRRRGVPRDEFACGAAMEAFGKAGRVSEALRLLKEMRWDGPEANLQCYNSAIEACCRVDDIDGGMSLLAELGRATSLTPDAASFEPLVAACQRKEKQDVAQDLRNAMARLGYSKDSTR